MSEQRPPVPPPREAARSPIRVEPVPGTPYGLAIYGVPPATSGTAIGALLAGIASILVSFVVACLGLGDVAASIQDGSVGSGALVGGAFAVLAGFFGVAGIGLGVAGVRQVRRAARRPDGEVRGRGLAIAGIVCGGVGLTIAICSFGAAGLAALT